MSTIDLNRVRLFVRVAEAGSFTSAARLCGLPTSSVSRAVAALERELAVRLIQRTTRRLQLTEAGRVYYESVSRALSGMDEAAAAVSELQDAPRGRVRITAPADDTEFVGAAAAAGQGLTLLPILACQGRGKDDLQRVLPEYAPVGVPLQLVYPTARFLPKRVVLLRDPLVNELPPLLKV